MAKDLPFFKFFVSEWNDGDISHCSMEAQGLFINICAIYWSRGCDGNTTAMRILCDRNATALKELVSAKIIKKTKSNISINFLLEQLQEAKIRGEKNSENASKRWKKDATAIRPHSNGIAKVMPIREEEIREDNIRKEGSLKIYGDQSSDICVIIQTPYANDPNYKLFGVDGYKEFVETELVSFVPKSDEPFLARFLREKNANTFEGQKSYIVNSFKKYIKDLHK